MKNFFRVIPSLILLLVGGCSREDLDKWRAKRFINKAIKEGQRPEMEKKKIVEIFQNNKQRFIELRDQMSRNKNASQIAFAHPPGAYGINYTYISKENFNYESLEKEFGIQAEWLHSILEEMKTLNCRAIQKSKIYEDIDPSMNHQPPRYEILEFELETGGFFGPDWTKGVAYYSHDYMPKTRENGFGGQWTFFQYFNKIEDNWYVYSRR